MAIIEENKQPETVESNKVIITKSDSSESQKFTVAIIILVVYLLFIAYMLYNSDAKDLSWSRMLYLFSGIEAIVFAALGYVFGKDIHRIRAEKAEENVDQAKKETEKAKKETENAKKETEKAKTTAQEEKEKGIKLSTAVLSRNASLPKDETTRLKGITLSAAIKDNSDDNYLVSLAKSLYESDSFPSISFEYTISPADKIDYIVINGEKQTQPRSGGKGYYSGVPVNENLFTIDVKKDGEFVEWTFIISNVWDSRGIERKQKGGKLVSDRDTADVQLVKL